VTGPTGEAGAASTVTGPTGPAGNGGVLASGIATLNGVANKSEAYVYNVVPSGLNPNTSVVVMNAVGPTTVSPHYFYVATGITGGVTGTSILLVNQNTDAGRVAWALLKL
jgi:hypothetical protein